MKKISDLYKAFTLTLFTVFFAFLFYEVFITPVWWDDSYFGSVAKNIAEHHRYSAVFFDKDYLFHYGISVGPLLIFPLALMIAVFGNQYWVPGLTIVSIIVLLSLFLYKTARNFFKNYPPVVLWKFLFFTLILCILFSYNVAGYKDRPFGIWHLFLGEIPAFIMFLIGVLGLFAKHKSNSSIFVAGLWLSAAVNTKIITLIGVGASGAIFLFYALHNKYRKLCFCGGDYIFSRIVALGLGFILPLLFWELFKIYSFGIEQYISQIQDFKKHFSSLALDSPETPITRTVFLMYTLGAPAIIFGIPLLTCLFLTNNRKNINGDTEITPLIYAMLFSFFIHTFWYIGFSFGGSYIFIGILYFATFASLRLTSTIQNKEKKPRADLHVIAGLFFVFNFAIIYSGLTVKDISYKKLKDTEYIKENLISLKNKGNIVLFSCGNNFELEYLLPGNNNFRYCGEAEEFLRENKNADALLVTYYETLPDNDLQRGKVVTISADQNRLHLDLIPEKLRSLCSDNILKTATITVNRCKYIDEKIL